MVRLWPELEELPTGARVVIALPSGDTLASVLLACFERELVAVPLHPRTGRAQLADIVTRVSAALVVTETGGAVQISRTGLPAEHPDAAGLAFIMFTSGSTGAPKGVMLSRRAVLGNAGKTARLHRFSADRPHATCLPLYHCNALVMSLIGTHITGTPLVLHGQFDPSAYFQDLAAKQVATASVVPALLPDLLEARPPWPPGLDYLITAAAPLTTDLARRFHECYGPRLRQGYGLTEAVNFSFTMPLLSDQDFAEHYLTRHPPVGQPLPDTQLRLEHGEVWISTPDLMDGYWEDPAATREAITQDGWLRTGDLGELRDGLLVLNGRSKERINRGGEKHYPLDLERQWRALGLTGAFAAVAVPEATLGHEVGLVAATAPVSEVRTVCAQAAVRPAVVRFGGFETTSTGKPRRTAMGTALVVRRESATRHERLLAHAAATAGAILRAHPRRPAEPRAGRVHDQLTAFRRAVPHDESRTADRPSFVHQALDAMVEFWPLFAAGPADNRDEGGTEFSRTRTEVLRRLPQEWPLAVYTELAEQIAHAGQPDGAATDETPTLLPRPPSAEHTATAARTALANGTRLVFPHWPTEPDTAASWPLRFLLAFWADDTNDTDGTHPAPPVSRWRYCELLRSAGFRTVTCSMLRAGRFDLGGVIWAQ